MAVAALNPVDAYVYSNADDSALRQKLVDIANTLGCTGKNSEWVAFFQNPANIAGIKEAVAVLGMPSPNRPSERRLLKWVDFCEWQSLYKFYFYAKIAVDYPALKEDKVNCSVVNEILKSLESEKSASEKRALTDASLRAIEMEVLDAKLSDFKSFKSRYSCDEYLRSVTEKKAQVQALQSQQQSAKLIEQQYKSLQAAPSNELKMATYIAVGVGVLVTGIIVVRLFKKS